MMGLDELTQDIDSLQNSDDWNLETFKYTEYGRYDFEQYIDPDNNIFNDLNKKCNYYTEEQLIMKLVRNDISIIHFNGRSMYTNFGKIQDHLNKYKNPFNIIAITETWFDLDRGTDFPLKGYELIYKNRENKVGGGVALYVDCKLKHKVIESMSIIIDDILECLTIEICRENHKNIIISCVYRAPGTDIETFRNTIENLLSKCNQKTIFLCGDNNIDLLNPHKHKSIDEFIDTMYSINLYPLITRPTRITRNTATLIDNIFTNEMGKNMESGLLVTDITDHLPVFVIYKCDYVNTNTTDSPRYKRLLTERSIAALKQDLLAQNWNTIYDETNTNTAYDIFLSIFMKHFDKNCPLHKCKEKKSEIKKPWITPKLRNACRKKNTLYKEFIRHRTIETEHKYKRYKNKLIHMIRTSKKEYFNNMLENHKNNAKGLWSVLNKIIKKGAMSTDYPQCFNDNGKTITKLSDIANGFNDFFVNIGPTLADAIITPLDGSRPAEEWGFSNQNSMFLKAVEEQEVIDTVRKYNNKTSTDHNDISMCLVKKIIDAIIKPFTYICNLSFRNGIFPNKMKTAKVIPIHKAGDKQQFTNYRPISLLSQFSKILEKLFGDRLDHFVEKNNLLSESQYGFRCKRSPAMALIELTEEVINNINNKMFTVGVFVDLKKAFDTLNHDILIRKMEKYGFRGVVLNWIKSYIKNREQFVQIGDCKSSCRTLICGVPQGSVLGPKLFNLYINDLPKVSSVLKCVLFADDTNIFCSGEDIQQLLEVITKEMSKIQLWFNKNKLSLNLTKTKCMVFGNRKINTEIQLIIDNNIIERVYENKFLGVIVDHKLCWKPHIEYVRAKMAKSIFVISRAREILNPKSMHTLYCTLILPYMYYCSEVWGNTYKTTLNTLVTLQKRAIRLINNVGYRDHTHRLFTESHVLKFTDMVNYKTLQVMYKARYNQLPLNVQNKFLDKEGEYNLRRPLNFKKQVMNTNLKVMCISSYGVTLWNALEEEIQYSTNINQFKYKLKNSIFARYRLEVPQSL